MNKKIFLATFLLVSTTAFAQNTSVSQINKVEAVSSEGFRISLLRSDLNLQIKAEFEGQKFSSEKEKLDSTMGLSIGYASLPIQQLGWTTNLAYMEVKNNGTSGKIARIDGNLAFAVDQLFNVKGGLNLSKLRSPEDDDYKPAVGLQAGVGLQITRNVGIDLNYIQMRNTISIPAGLNTSAEGTIILSGAELALTGTF